MVRVMSANTSMRSEVTRKSHGWVLWALAAKTAALTRARAPSPGASSASQAA